MRGRKIKLTDKQKVEIEDICGEIYMVGHAHGGNTYRGFIPNDAPKDILKHKQPQKVDVGWGKYANELIKLIEGIL